MKKEIRDRIIEIRKMRGKDLQPCPVNWRQHPQSQRDALRGILAEVGVADVLKAWIRPDGVVELIDGHLRAEELQDHEWNVAILDVTEPEARYLLATHDPLGAMATADAGILDALLRDINSGEDAVTQMLADLAEGAGLYDVKEVEPPDMQEGDREPFRQVTFTLHDSQHETLVEAMRMAKESGGDKSEESENSNGNILAHICEGFINGNR